MQRLGRVLVALLMLVPIEALAGPSEDVASTVNRWAMAFNARLEKSGDKVKMDVRKVVVLDDNVAYVAGFDEFTAVRNGQTGTSSNGFTMILVRRGDQWLVTHQHSSRR